MKKYFSGLVILSFVVIALHVLFTSQLAAIDPYWKILIFFFSFESTGLRLLFEKLKHNADQRTLVLFVDLIVRFLFPATLFVILLQNLEFSAQNKTFFGVHFFVIYLFYTVFDIYSLIANLRQISD